MDPVAIVQMVGRLRRQFSRHPDVLGACAELERLGTAEQQRAIGEPRCAVCGSSGDVIVRCAACWHPMPEKPPPKRDRAAYMRGYRLRKA